MSIYFRHDVILQNVLIFFDSFMKMQEQKCKDENKNVRTTEKAIPWIASSKSSNQKPYIFWTVI